MTTHLINFVSLFVFLFTLWRPNGNWVQFHAAHCCLFTVFHQEGGWIVFVEGWKQKRLSTSCTPLFFAFALAASWERCNLKRQRHGETWWEEDMCDWERVRNVEGRTWRNESRKIRWEESSKRSNTHSLAYFLFHFPLARSHFESSLLLYTNPEKYSAELSRHP